MKIKKININGFGKLSDMSLEFDDKVNVIFGDNEAGKSTLQTFIRGMFFSLRSQERGKRDIVSNLEKYRPINNNSYEGSLLYSLDDSSEYTIERNFDSNSVKLYDSNLSNVTNQFDIDRYQGPKFAQRQFGLGVSSFEQTCFIGQFRVRIPNKEGKRIIDDLSDENNDSLDMMSYESAREALMDTLKTSVGTERTKKSPINIVESKLDELYDEKRSLEQKRDYFVKFSNILQNPNFQKKDLLVLINSCEDNPDLQDELRGHMLSMDEYDTKLEELKTVASGLEKQLTTYKQMLVDYQNTLNSLKIFRRFAQGTVDDMVSSKNRILQIQNNQKELTNSRAQLIRPSSVNRITYFVCCVLFAAAAVYWKKYFFISCAIIAAIMSFVANKKYTKEKLKFNANKEYLDSRLSGCEREIVDLNEVINSTISRANVSTLEEFVALKSRYDSTYTLYNSSKKSISDCEERIKSINESINDYKKLLSDVVNNMKNKFNISSFNKLLSELNQKIKASEEEKEALEEKRRALNIAISTLEEVNNDLGNDFIPTLNRRLSDILGKLTNQKYTNLSCNNSFDIHTKHVDSMSIVPLQYLSGGTIDQIYLAMRIGLCDVICENTHESLPLIFDEIFAHYDDTRTKCAIDFFEELSQDHQIILFTCKHRELEMLQDKFGDSLNVINLNTLEEEI